MPWAGGLNAAQYNTIDLNLDGIDDLVLFDRTSNKINTFLADNGEYLYSPDYESFFPEGMSNWVILRDYDCDGRKDIFTSSSFGMTLYRNTSESDILTWEIAADPVTTLGTGSILPIKINGSDIPAIEDIDGDGDLDVLMFGFNGGGLQYHQNFSMERTGECGLPDYERITTSWGKFSECGCGIFVFDKFGCKPSGGKQLHVGGKSLMAYDMDGDGDMEVVIGEEDCNTLYLFENKGTPIDPIMDSFTKFPNNTDPAEFISFPAAYLEDVTFDGIKDLIVTPNRSSNSTFLPSDFENSNWLYGNSGTNQVPNFQFNSRNFLQSSMIDQGNNSSVALTDTDGDGDLDMMVSSHGVIRPFSGYNSHINLYENIGTKAVPSFVLLTEDYLDLSSLQMSNMKLQIVDMNSDGKLDVVVAATLSASSNHLVFYFLNNSSSGIDITNQPPQIITLNPRILSFDNPLFYDVNEDGLIDLLMGKNNGNLFYYENTGTKELPFFPLVTESFYGIGQSFTQRNLIPVIGDLDADGNMDLVTTDGNGTLTIYDDFENNMTAPLEGISNNYYNTLTQDIGAFSLGVGARPSIADLRNSGTPFIILGTAQGGIQVLGNVESLPPQNDKGDLLSLFPNPGNIFSNDGVIQIASKEPLEVSIISILGQEVFPSTPITPSKNLSLSIASLPIGMYLVIGKRSGKIVDQVKFIVTD
jgi:hypothetical protein